MEILQAILNNKISRIVFGIIVMCALGSPAVNGYTDNRIWLHLAIVWMVFVIASCFSSFKFSDKTNWIIYIILAGMSALLAILIVKFA